VSEKSTLYWLEGVRQLKKRWPDRTVVASIMAPDNEVQWTTLAKWFEAAGADFLEMNLSCPHGTGEHGMGLALGQFPDVIARVTKWVVQAVKIPVFVKMTPNITEILLIAEGAFDGGAHGVTATNTVSALMSVKPNGTPWPTVNGKSTYGGYCGTAIRPMTLRSLSRIYKDLIKGTRPGREKKVVNWAGRKSSDFVIMATGGIENGDTGLQCLHCGASTCQISTAIQATNFAIISDINTGLQALMFINAHPEKFAGWEGQAPPLQLEERRADARNELSYAGDGLRERLRLIAEDIMTKGILTSVLKIDKAPKNHVKKAASVNSLIGKTCSMLSAWHDMDPGVKHPYIAKIDNDMCVGCGRCYQSCADTGYQAIRFDEDTHIPTIVDEDCTGCTLCYNVCPVRDCITMVKSPFEYHAHRGFKEGDFDADSALYRIGSAQALLEDLPEPRLDLGGEDAILILEN